MIGWVCALVAAATPGAEAKIDAAGRALDEFRPEAAVKVLTSTPTGLQHHLHATWYEQLAIAHAYLEQPEPSKAAFRSMLSLDPGRFLSYTLSPKVTFLFEEARREVRKSPLPTVDLAWARTLRTVDSPQVDIEVVHDPLGFLAQGVLHYRFRNDSQWSKVSVAMPRSGSFVSVQLPSAKQAKASTALELYLVVKDRFDNEVLLIGSRRQPRQIDLRYQEPIQWYEQWWLWTAVGVVAAAGTAAAVLIATDEPDQDIRGTVSFP